MSRISERISALVSQQLPEFVRSDYSTFVAFLEAYYKFLEQDQGSQEIIQNARQYSDIDKTASSFINYFLQNYGNLIPNSILVDKPLLIKRLNDLYAAKGSELSFRLLFRILFDTTVSVRQPYEYVLRPSDGQWDQQISIRVRTVSGSVENITNRILKYEKNGVLYEVPIVRVKELTDDLTELFIKTNQVPPFTVPDLVYVNDGTNDLFYGTIDPTTVVASVLSGGAGFKAGQIFTVNLEGAIGTVVQIKSVDGNGAITSLKFISYGYDFPNETISIDLYNDLTIGSRSFKAETKTNSIKEDVEIVLVYLGTEPDRYFFSDYVEQGYNGQLLMQSALGTDNAGGSTFTTSTTDPNAAVIAFEMGAVGRYPGQFISNRGFLSEPDVRLQDDKLYQPFAYQLETDIDISKFYDIVRQLIHPAGTNLFNSRAFTANASVKANVSVITRANVFTELYSAFELNDIAIKDVTKNVSESSTVTDASTWELSRTIDELLETTDSELKQFEQTNTESIPVTDDTAILDISQTITDTPTANDIVALDITYNINNTISNVSFTDSVFYTVDNYAEAGYFAETYAGESVQLA